MTRTSTSQRLTRLEDLAARLKDREFSTVSEIANDFGVSVRTITRDIQLLKDQGLPIDADRGRGGGIRLAPHWGVGRVKFSYAQAVDLLVSLAVAEQMKSPFFMAHLGPIRRKLLASFPPDIKQRAKGLKARILIGESASTQVLSAFSSPHKNVVEKLHEAFVLMNRIEMTYTDGSGAKTKRTIDPHYLLLSSPIWYILGWDHLRQDVRTFRCDRILKITQQHESFKLYPIERFKKSLDGVTFI